MTENVKYEEILKDSFKNTLDSLKEMNNVTRVDVENEKIKDSLQGMNESIEKSIQNTTKGIEKLKENMRWGTVHIALLGETNAGKSTLIEALIKGQGQTIGTGEKDFTKKASFVEFDDKVLIDLPGIEGNEALYIDEIKNGINKAHYVFYVSSSQKEPEEETLKKIKSYLKEQTNIYSIVNVRTPIKLKSELVDNDSKIVMDRTNQKFKKAFGSHYKGMIPVNANAAFVLRTPNDMNKKVLKLNNKLIKKFGDTEEAYQYTNIDAVIKAIKTANSKEVIIANTYKFFNVIEETITNILRSKKGLDEQIKNIKKELQKVKEAVKVDIGFFEQSLLKSTKLEIQKFKNNIIELADEIKKKQWDHSKIELEIKDKEDEFAKQIKKVCQAEFEDLSKRIQRNYNEMSNQIRLNIKFTDLNNDFINVEDLLADFTLDFSPLLKYLLDATLGALAGSMLGVIGVASSLITSVSKWFIKGPKVLVNKKRKEMHNTINEKIQEMENETTEHLKSYVKDLEISIEKENQKLEVYIKRLRVVSINLNKQINYITDIKSKISKELIKFIEGTEVEYAYIDYKLKAMFCIGEFLKHRELYNLKFFQIYKNIGEFQYAYNEKIHDGFIYLKNNEEFQKRAISAFINYLKENYESFVIKGVRREKNEN